MNTNQAIEKAVSKIIPKPSKRDIIKATAKAIYEKRCAEFQAAMQSSDAAKERMFAALRAVVTAPAGTVMTFDYRSYGTPSWVSVEIKIAANNKIISKVHSEFVATYKAIPKRPELKEIHDELACASSVSAPGVDQLLSDPDLKQRLIKAGEAILAERAKVGAINV